MANKLRIIFSGIVLMFCIFIYKATSNLELKDNGSIKLISIYNSESDRILLNGSLGTSEKAKLLWTLVQEARSNKVLPWKTYWPSDAEKALLSILSENNLDADLPHDEVAEFIKYMNGNYPKYNLNIRRLY